MPDMPATVLSPDVGSPDPQMQVMQAHINHVSARFHAARDVVETLRRGRKLTEEQAAGITDEQGDVDYKMLKYDFEQYAPFAGDEKEKSFIANGIKFLQPKITTKAAPAQ